MRRAKIVCTLGPASDSVDQIEALIQAGMDVARLNFSHGSREGHARVIQLLRGASERLRKPIAILQDLQGPKIRIGTLAGDLDAVPGDELVLSVDPARAAGIPLAYPTLLDDLRKGHRILLDDGQIELTVSSVAAPLIRCEVVSGGRLRSAVGVHVPRVRLQGATFTPKDEDDLRFGMEQKVDFVALSFVQGAHDVLALQDRIRDLGASVPVIAKFERAGAVDELDAILEASDGVMVARGDLGVELPPEEVPLVQKRIIAAANQAGVFVITATQMLESMTTHPRPTRAETSDVANAVLDGTDAVMLSGETAVGDYPVETLRMMSRIVERAEAGRPDTPARLRRLSPGTSISVPDAIGHAAVTAADDVGARAIVAFTQSGSTARLISKRRPDTPIIAFTPHESVCRRLCLCWGTQPYILEMVDETDRMVDEVEARLLVEGDVEAGDPIVILLGAPITAQGSTNLLKLHRIGSPIYPSGDSG